MDNFLALNYEISFDNTNLPESCISLSLSPHPAHSSAIGKNYSQHIFCCEPLVSECASVVFPDISRYNINAILRRPSAKPATVPVGIRSPKFDSGTIPFGVRSLRLWGHSRRDPESKIRLRSHSRRDPGKYVKNISLVREKNQYYCPIPAIGQ